MQFGFSSHVMFRVIPNREGQAAWYCFGLRATIVGAEQIEAALIFCAIKEVL